MPSVSFTWACGLPSSTFAPLPCTPTFTCTQIMDVVGQREG